MLATIDIRHDCDGDGIMPGAIPVVRRATSACCGEVLAEGGTDEDGHTCTGCSKPTTKVLGPATAHWTCACGTRRSQVITEAQDDTEAGA